MDSLVDRLSDAAMLRVDERVRENLCLEAATAISNLQARMEGYAKSILRLHELCTIGDLSPQGALNAAAEDARQLLERINA